MHQTLLLLATLAVYFALLLWLSGRTARRADNDTFFRAGRRSPWWMVGFGMIGASISGVSFVSVPGWVATTGMTYLQMCAGFFFGYIAVAFVLLPLYYRLRLTSIYTYLEGRFGARTHRVGALFFVLGKLAAGGARLYLACLVLQQFVCVPGSAAAQSPLAFLAIALVVLVLIWAYTRRGGIFTLVRTDMFQTACLLLALVALLAITVSGLGLTPAEAVRTVADSPMSRVFEWDPGSPQAFWRQFSSGIFVVVVMTGLDQSMMQKNLTCKSLREAQRNMCAYGACFLPLNLLLLSLGVLLHALCAARGITPPAAGDALLPTLVADGVLGPLVVIPFTVGVVAAAFASTDSTLTALTTSCCIDLLRLEDRGLSPRRAARLRRRVHVCVVAAFLASLFLFRAAGGPNVINTIYVLVSYTYGPLLGLYAFGLATRRRPADRLVPWIVVASPVVCSLLDFAAPRLWGYTFGYELLMLNGLLTMVGLWLISRRGQAPVEAA